MMMRIMNEHPSVLAPSPHTHSPASLLLWTNGRRRFFFSLWLNFNFRNLICLFFGCNNLALFRPACAGTTRKTGVTVEGRGTELMSASRQGCNKAKGN